MTLSVGFHWLQSPPDAPIFPAAVAFEKSEWGDDRGEAIAAHSGKRVYRVRHGGKTEAQIAEAVVFWSGYGFAVQAANEVNLPNEGGWSPDEHRRWFANVARLALPAVPWLTPMSPSGNWQDYLSDEMAAISAGILCHAYGDFAEMQDAAIPCLDLARRHGKKCRITECNFGAGREVDVDAWVRDHLRPFCDWLAREWGDVADALCLFAARWPEPDSTLRTSLDFAGTAAETFLREWRPPTPSTTPKEGIVVPNPVFTPSAGHPANSPQEDAAVATTLRFVDISNYQGYVDMSGWKAAEIDGVIIRLSEDGSPNDQFGPANWQHAKDCGLLRACYHVSDPRFASPAQSLTTFGNAIDAAGGLDPDDVTVLDAELGDPGDQSRWLAEWGDGSARKFGKKSLMYSAPWWLGPHGGLIEGVAEQFAGLWDAYYTGNPNALPPAIDGWKKLVMVQWTANGSVPGVAGDVDLDTFLGSREDWLALGYRPTGVTPASPSTQPAINYDPITSALDNIWDVTLDPAINEARRASAQRAIDVLKGALGRV